MRLSNVFSLLALAGACEASDAVRHSRRLSFERIAGYEPGTLVTSHNAIDLDQKEIEKQLALGTDSGINAAMAIYSRGAFSDPIAKLNLTQGLSDPLSVGDQVIGFTVGGAQEVKAYVIDNYPKASTDIQVEYDVNEIQESFVGCQVGANPNPKTEGCFAAEGKLVVSGFSEPLSYTYNILEDNVNGRTIKGLSTESKFTMDRCTSCPYVDYAKFVDYYGELEYADQWITSASDGSSTDWARGNADFGTYGKIGKAEAIKKGAAYMNIWMYVVREMEDALDDCATTDPIDSGVHAWDEAVAFYTGSLEGTNGLGEGVLMYSLADKRCKNFRTCGTTGDSTVGGSYVNQEVLHEFKSGQRTLKKGGCDLARKNKERIVQLMTVPLIQGTLRYAYLQWSGVDTSEKAEAEGASFAAAVLPFVHFCDENDASIIYKNMKVGHGIDTDFPAVKKAFENNYDRLILACSDVGGVWDPVSNSYYDKAGPCRGSGGNSKSSEDTNIVGLAVGLSVGGGILIAIVVILSQFCGAKAAAPPSVDTQGKGGTAEIS